jgi:hypothetical protein
MVTFEGVIAKVAVERAEFAQERADLLHEIKAIRKHKVQQKGRLVLTIGGYRYETSVETSRCLPQTFFHSYFSGRYAQDVCADCSIFVDRDGERFGHVLEYMRDGHVSIVELDARPSVSLLRALKREFGYYCIELTVEPPPVVFYETVYIMGGRSGSTQAALSSMERFDKATGEWTEVARMTTVRAHLGASAIDGHIYVTGGKVDGTRGQRYLR